MYSHSTFPVAPSRACTTAPGVITYITPSCTIGTVSVIQNAAAPTGAGAWTSATYNAAYTTTITGITAAENQASLLIRWISTSAASSTGGTARIDNVQIQGTLVPAPGAAALVGLAGLMARRRRA